MNFNQKCNIIKSKLEFKLNSKHLLKENIIHHNENISPRIHNRIDKLNKWKIINILNHKLFIRPSKQELEKRNIFNNRKSFGINREKIRILLFC